MSVAAQNAVEFTLGPDHLDIWVDANNNGVRDDDDVNIYITSSGGFYTTSPTFKKPFDNHIQTELKEVAIEMLKRGGADQKSIDKLRDLALDLVVKATAPAPSENMVKINFGKDNLDIWVDTNNNGVQDDDDVNIYVTVSGGFYTTSPTFKYPLDAAIQAQIKEQAIAMLTRGTPDQRTLDSLRQLALDLVVKATADEAVG
jgi:hypothetical protein